MKYRRFGKMDWKSSVLGLSVVNIPLLSYNTQNIDRINLIRYAINHGVNYIDLGYLYNFLSEINLYDEIKTALKDGYRQKVKIAVNIPANMLFYKQDFDKYLNKQIDALDLGKADFCMIEGLNRKTWSACQERGVLDWLEKSIGDNLIENAGFSFHDDVMYLRNIIEAYSNWTFCQFKYSFMDVRHHPGTGGIKFASEKGLAVIVQEPLKGRRLTENVPESANEIWSSAKQQRTLTEWCLRSVWNENDISSVIGDIYTIEQLKEHITLAESVSSDPGNLTVDEILLTEQVKDAYYKIRELQCTACGCCMPCQFEVDIPRIIELFNDTVMYNNAEISESFYYLEKQSLDKCTECGQCAKACPKRFPVLDLIRKAKQLFNVNNNIKQ